MLSIISTTKSPRLEYVCEFIFTHQLNVRYEIGAEKNYKHVIGYGVKVASGINIPSTGLLFENDIKVQDIRYSEIGNKRYLFSYKDEGFFFDIFSAIFYLISRYEEYLPHRKDKYGRYDYTQSVAAQKAFLDIPLIDEWLEDFKKLLLQQFPTLAFKNKKTAFIPTYDIDIAFSFLGKGWIRNIGGFLKSPSTQRLNVVRGKEKDPYDSYDFLDGLHEQYRLCPIYFFLVAPQLGEYDKNIDVKSKRLQNLIKRHAAKYEIGIHPSWQSFLDAAKIENEKEYLTKISGAKITASRQHYIKLNLPEGYQLLLEAGITDDYSMGYGAANGFRASTANSFHWFDLGRNASTKLVVHPFCFMDSTSVFVNNKSSTEALLELQILYAACKKYESPCIAIYHNNLLGDSPEARDYGKMYEKFLSSLT